MKKRIISILLALSMTVSAGVSALAAPSDIPFEQRAMAVDTIKADKAIEAFESDLKKSNNYDKVFEDYKSLMDIGHYELKLGGNRKTQLRYEYNIYKGRT